MKFLLCLLPSIAFAQSPDRDIAKRHLARGQELYEAGLYTEAVHELSVTLPNSPTVRVFAMSLTP